MAADVPFSATETGRIQAQRPAATRILPEAAQRNNADVNGGGLPAAGVDQRSSGSWRMTALTTSIDAGGDGVGLAFGGGRPP